MDLNNYTLTVFHVLARAYQSLHHENVKPMPVHYLAPSNRKSLPAIPVKYIGFEPSGNEVLSPSGGNGQPVRVFRCSWPPLRSRRCHARGGAPKEGGISHDQSFKAQWMMMVRPFSKNSDVLIATLSNSYGGFPGPTQPLGSKTTPHELHTGQGPELSLKLRDTRITPHRHTQTPARSEPFVQAPAGKNMEEPSLGRDIAFKDPGLVGSIVSLD